MKENLEQHIVDILKELGVAEPKAVLEHPDDLSFGDYTTNAALMYSKDLKEKPFILAEKIVSQLKEKKIAHVEQITIAGPGFINIFLDRTFFSEEIKVILSGETDRQFASAKSYGELKKVVVEYTDPNPFKEFHIGHLMSNAIGESISRIIENGGAQVKRACYQGDVGLHVAKAIYGMKLVDWSNNKSAKVLGEAYAKGSQAFEDESTDAKKEIIAINKKVYDRSDSEVNTLYDEGRKVSLDYFEEIYKKLGTRFDLYFFESKTGVFGKEIVEQHISDGIFEKSDNAIVFKGENHDPKLHTRVFINSEGLPTYEAKELGLAKIKYDTYPYTTSVVVTGNEINDYFKVLLKAMSLVFPELAAKTVHKSHGMLRLPTGKMSSRTGQVVTAESLIADIETIVNEKIKGRELTPEQSEKIATQVAIAAIKYSILRQSPGSDIIFDLEKSVSFEGDSGPYLQYASVRASSVLAKAEGMERKPKVGLIPEEVSPLEKILYRLPEVSARALAEYSPHYLVIYLTQVASAFNSWYGNTKIIDDADPYSPYKLAVVQATKKVLDEGLYLLGIEVPEKM